MPRTPWRSQILLDVGLSTGDEGKGRLIPELVNALEREQGSSAQGSGPVAAVIKVNGGANSGHSVANLKLNLIPAGAACPEVEVLALASGVVADPRKLDWESRYVEHKGHVLRPRLRIDEKTMVSDLSHRLLDLGWEYYRQHVLGAEARGSTGRGISPAYADESLQFQLFYYDFRGPRAAFSHRFRTRMQRALDTLEHVCRVPAEHWPVLLQTLTQAEQRASSNAELIEAGLLDPQELDFRRFAAPGEAFALDLDALETAYWEAGQAWVPHLLDLGPWVEAALRAGRYVIGEFGQAFWLDKRMGFAPNVTASHTVPAEFFLSCGLPLQDVHTFGVVKAYDTKVGTHHFPCQIPEKHPLGTWLKQLEFGVSTGRQRMVGWYDAVEKGEAIRRGGCHELVINKLDALSHQGPWQGGELLVATAYQLPDGTVTHTVPRDPQLHRQVRPVYRQLPSWGEDLSAVRTFDNLPLAAKRYLATLVEATFRVAYGPSEHWPQALPHLRYIGVGPEPDQIITDAPEPRELVALAG